jgi:flagellar basal-body rod protein FlgG
LVEPDRTARDWSAGTLRHTGSSLNFAIEGEGWFQLRSPQGMVLTRDGEFQLDRSGRLVSAQGWPVELDSDASLGSSTPDLNKANELWVDGERVAQFVLAKVEPKSLEALGAGLYRAANGAGGGAPGDSTATVRQGFLESSNVNTLSEMVDLMEAMRAAEGSQRIARAYDEALETAITTLGEF